MDIQESQQSEEIILFQSEEGAKGKQDKAYPWFLDKNRKISEPLLRMHNQVIDFYLYMSREGDKQAKQQRDLQVFYKLKEEIQAKWPDANVCAPFLKHKIYLRGTQQEIFVLLPELTAIKAEQVTQHIYKSNPQRKLTKVPSKQDYPLFQYQLVFPNKTPVFLRIMDIQTWNAFFSLIDETLSSTIQFKYLYILFSFMIRSRWMHMEIRSFLLFGLLSVFYHERRKQRKRMLSQTILKFLEYFGVGPFHERRIVYVGKGKYQLTIDHGSFSFWVGGTNIANQSCKDLFGVLKNRYRLISNFNFEQGMSIVGSLVNPCGKQFQY